MSSSTISINNDDLGLPTISSSSVDDTSSVSFTATPQEVKSLVTHTFTFLAGVSIASLYYRWQAYMKDRRDAQLKLNEAKRKASEKRWKELKKQFYLYSGIGIAVGSIWLYTSLHRRYQQQRASINRGASIESIPARGYRVATVE